MVTFRVRGVDLNYHSLYVLIVCCVFFTFNAWSIIVCMSNNSRKTYLVLSRK